MRMYLLKSSMYLLKEVKDCFLSFPTRFFNNEPAVKPIRHVKSSMFDCLFCLEHPDFLPALLTLELTIEARSH